MDIKPDERALDIGCGTGRGMLELAAAVGTDGRVFGIDIAPGMIRRAQRRCERGGVSVRHGTVLGDARSLPFESNAVDVVLLSEVLELFDTDDASAVLGEVARVLDDGGRVGVVSMDVYAGGIFAQLYEFVYRHVPGGGRFGCRPIDVEGTIEAADFDVTSIERLRVGIGWPVTVVVCRPPSV